MYCWLSKIIANDYVFIKNLKKNEQSEVSVYSNKYNGKRVLGTTGFAAPEQYGIAQSDRRFQTSMEMWEKL